MCLNKVLIKKVINIQINSKKTKGRYKFTVQLTSAAAIKRMDLYVKFCTAQTTMKII